ncbi:hypothetical protein C1H46_020397 [Malus baccata]|uniref:Helicase ATP-binding domain-containing protein n=1 Tax=Malus baccata TaxID=106549 RepID=A0A540M621_MALBA|nr:hypothetical protein C1H46_020397 [Malus baccata]
MDPVEAANGLSFRVGFSGHSGHLRLEPLSTVESSDPVKSLPDFILPPAFPRETPESIKEYIEEKYLSPRLDDEVFAPEKVGRQWDFDWFDKANVPLEPTLPRCVVVPTWELPFRRQKSGSAECQWEPKSVEVDVSELIVGAQESGSLPRLAGPAKDFVRGSINNRPFRPGGLDDSQSLERVLPDGASNGEWVRELLVGGSPQAVPPSFKQGMDLGDLKSGLSVQFDDLFKKAWEEDVVEFEGDGQLSGSESVKSEDEAKEVDVAIDTSEPELSLLDEILSVAAGESKSRSNGIGEDDEQNPKKAWAISGGTEYIAENFHDLVPDKALDFPFELDKFQKEAIYYLEKGDSVFVAAHTSAGKTVVAEYAFALASKHCTRAVYTAPIKTISNQKYRDLCGKFDVGLLTGDVSLRPEASCLIMTTEILRSMLYRGADIIRDIEWVIFDEVHYVNDVERGVVWEEVIIMLPRHINIVLLSATVPNKVEFADWIGRTKQKQIRVTGTTKRPVPLEHCLFYSGELYKICESEIFIPQGFKAAKDAFKKKNMSATTGGSGSQAPASASHDGTRSQKQSSNWGGKQKKQSGSQNSGNFSRTGGANQNNGNGMNSWGLRRSDASLWLSLINKLSKMSLLPVVFDTLRKFDGKEFRQLLPGEYTQMAGRAGRRGLDKIGTVIVMCRDEILEESDLKHVIVGSATKLKSQFRLTYIMILHLLRVEELKVEDMLKRSFAEFHAQKKLPEQQQLLMRKLAQPTKTIECVKCETAIEEYYDMYSEAAQYSKEILEAVMQSPIAKQFLTTGRVVVMGSNSAQDHLLGVVVKAPSANNKQYIVLVLKPELLPQTPLGSGNLQDSKNTDFPQGYFVVPKSKRALDEEYRSGVTPRKASGVVKIKLPHQGSAAGVSFEVKEVDSKDFLCICNCKIKIDQVGLLEDNSNAAYSKTVQQLLDTKSDRNEYPPALDPYKDLDLRDVNLVGTYYKWINLLQKMATNKCHGCIKLDEHIKLAREIKRHSEEVDALKFQMSDEALEQMPDFQGRIDVLKEIGCIDADLVVQIKGRVACEMNSGEELISTECLFENQLDDLEPEEAVALMSAFVFQQRNTSDPSLTPKLSQAKQRLYDTAIRLGQLQAHFNVQINPEEYARENLKFGLVEVVYEWAKGTPFADICELTDVPEGMIVRTIVRLDETCREFKNAASIMGNSALYKKMETASNAIKRDIVFAASLYVTGV